ncbi:MAG: hypothetical protein MZV70_54740 [Desulfobacterales bacterium]|nr:hypothetical protein [Desulfobacterales bacterium]
MRDMDEYLPATWAREAFGRMPQLRTVPVGKSINAGLEVLPYERAEEIVREQIQIPGRPLHLPPGTSDQGSPAATS